MFSVGVQRVFCRTKEGAPDTDYMQILYDLGGREVLLFVFDIQERKMCAPLSVFG